MSRNDSDIGAFLSGFVIGGLVGAAVALILAPQSGAETRSQIRQSSVDLRDRGQEAYQTARTRATETYETTRTRVGETTADSVLVIEGQDGTKLMQLTADDMERSFRPTLTRHLEGQAEDAHHG